MEKNLRPKLLRPQVLGLIIAVLVMAGFTVYGIYWMSKLQDPDILSAFQTTVESMGVRGWFILLVIQYVQIVFAFIPGGPIQIVAGALYGPWMGIAVCVVGTLLATFTVFSLVNKYGRRIIQLFVDEKDILQYKFLNDSKKLETLVVILFLIPGTPKDALTYLFALTPLSKKRFMLLSTLARLPGVATSVFAGDSIIQGNWLRAGILFGIIAAISLGGLLLHKKIKLLYQTKKKI